MSILYHLLLICLDEGRVYKIVQWYDDEGEAFSVLLDVFDVTPNEPIRAMAISSLVCRSFHYLLFSTAVINYLYKRSIQCNEHSL